MTMRCDKDALCLQPCSGPTWRRSCMIHSKTITPLCSSDGGRSVTSAFLTISIWWWAATVAMVRLNKIGDSSNIIFQDQTKFRLYKSHCPNHVVWLQDMDLTHGFGMTDQGIWEEVFQEIIPGLPIGSQRQVTISAAYSGGVPSFSSLLSSDKSCWGLIMSSIMTPC